MHEVHENMHWVILHFQKIGIFANIAGVYLPHPRIIKRPKHIVA